MPTLYRVESKEAKTYGAASRRPPSNVPYVVDNLWEWARPEHLPSRRGAAYASPTPALARDNASGEGDTLVTLQLAPDAVVLQLREDDAKWHPDCDPRKLRKTLFGLLNEAYPDWANQPAQVKLTVAPLFLPVTTREELDAVLGPGGPLATIAGRLRAAVTLWETLHIIEQGTPDFLSERGEVFFDRRAVIGRQVL